MTHLVDVGDDTTTGDRGLDERVELLVTTDGELQVARGDTLDLEVLGGVSRELKNLGGEVLCAIGRKGERRTSACRKDVGNL